MLDASFTQITDLELSNDINLWRIVLNSVPLKTINSQIIDSSSFSFCPILNELDIANTPFTKLDLSNNPDICFVNISGTSITKLDISSLHLLSLKATDSKLTDLICAKKDLSDLDELRVEHTPLEKDTQKISPLCTILPEKSVAHPGHLYTYSRYINNFADVVFSKNWRINE